MSRSRNKTRGVTLVELLVSLSVLAIISTAVTALLAGAGQTHQYLHKETDALAQVENAYRRILHNVRCAQSLTAPTTAGVTPTPLSTPQFSIVTQPDPSYGTPAGQPATVRYYLENGNLVENDPRFNPATNILVSDVRTFTVMLEPDTASTPNIIIITLESNTHPVIKRQVRIACRNQF